MMRFSPTARAWWWLGGVAGATLLIAQLARLGLADRIVYNPGVAFSMMLPPALILVVSSSLLVVLLIWFGQRPQRSARWIVACGLIIGGGVSNLLERLLFSGNVIDYIWLANLTTFNLADVAVLVGIGLIIYDFT